MANENIMPIAEKMETLGKSFTVTSRNVKILHWNYNDTDFIQTHLWLDDVFAELNECIDAVYEELRKANLLFDAKLSSSVANSPITELDSQKVYHHAETFSSLSLMCETLKRLCDEIATEAEENKMFTVHDLMVEFIAKISKRHYFIRNSILSE